MSSIFAPPPADAFPTDPPVLSSARVRRWAMALPQGVTVSAADGGPGLLPRSKRCQTIDGLRPLTVPRRIFLERGTRERYS
jgi:hypothetical protein